MSSQRVADMSQQKLQDITDSTTAMQQSSTKSSFQITAAIIQELKSLFFTDTAELYHNIWSKLKNTIHRAWQIKVNTNHLTELISAVRDLIKQQNMSHMFNIIQAVKTYVLALQSAHSSWFESLQICEVLMCLLRKLVVIVSNVTSQNWSRSIKQIMKNINKTKNQEIKKKILTVCRLFSDDVIVIMNTAAIKKQLEKNISWLSAVDSAVQVNCRCFSVMIHDMRIAFIDCSKQQKVISQLMKQNKHLWDAIEILHVCWLCKAVKQENWQ